MAFCFLEDFFEDFLERLDFLEGFFPLEEAVGWLDCCETAGGTAGGTALTGASGRGARRCMGMPGPGWNLSSI